MVVPGDHSINTEEINKPKKYTELRLRLSKWGTFRPILFKLSIYKAFLLWLLILTY